MGEFTQSQTPGQNPAPAGAVSVIKEGERHRHRVACRMLRLAGKMDFASLPLPQPRRSESVVDWLVRSSISPNHQLAAQGLIVAAGLADLLDEVMEETQSPSF